MLHRFVFHNGSVQEASKLSLSPGQTGLLAGWGVFSTLKVTEGVLFAFERHWARITRDAAAIHIPIPYDLEELKRGLAELVEANRAFESTLRLVIVRNVGGMWAAPNQERPYDVLALTADSKDWGNGVKLAYVPNGRFAASPFSGTKMLSWAPNLTWLESAHERGLDEVILLNERGEIAECTSANIFVAKAHRVFTPPLASGCLPGVTREILLSEIRVPGIEIEEKTLAPADMDTADEVFITSTTRNLLPVAEIGGRPACRTREVQTALGNAFAQYVEHYVASHKRVTV